MRATCSSFGSGSLAADSLDRHRNPPHEPGDRLSGSNQSRGTTGENHPMRQHRLGDFEQIDDFEVWCWIGIGLLAAHVLLQMFLRYTPW